MRKWGLLTEKVRRDRIRIAVAAWAYESGYRPIMSDQEYDDLSERVHRQRNIATGYSRLDRFFQRSFDPDTGMWVHRHPNVQGLINIYMRVHYFMLYTKAERKRHQRRARKRRG